MGKPKINYVSDIVTVEQQARHDVSNVPVFTIENCEVIGSSLTMETPISGHSISFYLPTNTTFKDEDRALRQGALLKALQKSNPDLEGIKSVLKTITVKDVEASKKNKHPITEDCIGKVKLSFQISNKITFNDADNKYVKDSDLKLLSDEDSVTVKYFRILDEWSGKGIDPVVFKYNDKGERVTTFVSPKDKQEKNLFLGKGDLVNIKVRPYLKENKRDGNYSLKYNLLSVEIVSTAFDRGLTGKSSSAKRETTLDFDDNLFAGVFGSTEIVKEEPKPVTKKKKVEEPISEEIPFDEGSKEEPKKVEEQPKEDPVATNTYEIDWSALGL